MGLNASGIGEKYKHLNGSKAFSLFSTPQMDHTTRGSIIIIFFTPKPGSVI
jgi:hypothetical protein